MSDTPRTDALEEKWMYATQARGNLQDALDDMFNECGQLERELAKAVKERDEARECLTTAYAVGFHKNDNYINKLKQERDEAKSFKHVLKSENAKLRKERDKLRAALGQIAHADLSARHCVDVARAALGEGSESYG